MNGTPNHDRVVVAIHAGYGEEAICAQCLKYWPCAYITKEGTL